MGHIFTSFGNILGIITVPRAYKDKIARAVDFIDSLSVLAVDLVALVLIWTFSPNNL
jgi:hypothetical protein